MDAHGTVSRIGDEIAQQPARVVVAVSIVLTLVVGLLDVVTGAEMSFSIFYLLPIVLTAWRMPRIWSVGFAVAASVTWFEADKIAGQVYSSALLPYWNASIRLGYFLLFAMLFSRLRASLDRERTLARLDPLTGLLNRRAFEEMATREVERASRYGRSMSVVFIDLDHFKSVNDRHGHDAGDAVLTAITEILVHTLRSTDVIGRLGGDEFAVVMPETTKDQALVALDKTRDQLRAAMSERNSPVTFSIGLVAVLADRNTSVAELLATADRLMYEAKATGRDRIVVSQYHQPSP